LKRYHITLGATTTAGGTVTTASSLSTIDGKPMALEGDKVSCPVCYSEGVIVCGGPRLPERWNGREFALEADFCVCKCVPAPALVANQTLKCQHLPAAPDSSRAPGAPGAAAVAGGTPQVPQAALRLVEEGTSRPCRNRTYRLDLADGRTLSGTTDDGGLTQPLTAEERASVVAWHVWVSSAD